MAPIWYEDFNKETEVYFTQEFDFVEPDIFRYKGLAYQITNRSENKVKLLDVPYWASVSVPAQVEFNNQKWTVTEIAKDAFEEAAGGLVELFLPNTIKTIVEGTFDPCVNLTTIAYPYHPDEFGCPFKAVTNKTNCTVAIISSYAYDFNHSPEWEGFKFDSYGTFSYAGLTYRVVDGKSKTVALTGAPNWAELSVPETVTYMNSNDWTVTEIDRLALTACTGTTEINLPATLTSIDNGALDNCKALNLIRYHIDGYKFGCPFKAVTNKANCTVEIMLAHNYWTFKDNPDWAGFKIVYPETVTHNNLTYRVIDSKNLYLSLYHTPLFKMTIDVQATIEFEGLTWKVNKIEKSALAGAIYAQTLNLPFGLETIEEDAFSSCMSLTTINYPYLPTDFGGCPFGAVTNKSACVVNVMPNLVDAFRAADVWKEFNIMPTDSLTVDGLVYRITDAEAKTVALCKVPEYIPVVVIPPTVHSMGSDWVVTTIDAGAFSGDRTSLRNLSLPYTLTELTPEVLNGCRWLTEIEYPFDVDTFDPVPFAIASGRKACTVIVSPSKVPLFKNSSKWNYFAIDCKRYFDIDDFGYEILNDPSDRIVALGYVPDQESVYVPREVEYDGVMWTVQTIKAGAFDNAAFNVCELRLPNSIIEIEEHAFDFATRLSTIWFPFAPNQFSPECPFTAVVNKGDCTVNIWREYAYEFRTHPDWKDFNLFIHDKSTNIDDAGQEATVKQVNYYDLLGRSIESAALQTGRLYIAVKTFTNGTRSSEKFVK